MDAQDKAKTSTEQQTVAMQLQNDAAGLLKMTLDGLNGKAISAAQAQNAFDSQLANMGTHVDKTGKTVQFTTTSNIGTCPRPRLRCGVSSTRRCTGLEKRRRSQRRSGELHRPGQAQMETKCGSRSSTTRWPTAWTRTPSLPTWTIS